MHLSFMDPYHRLGHTGCQETCKTVVPISPLYLPVNIIGDRLLDPWNSKWECPQGLKLETANRHLAIFCLRSVQAGRMTCALKTCFPNPPDIDAHRSRRRQNIRQTGAQHALTTDIMSSHIVPIRGYVDAHV